MEKARIEEILPAGKAPVCTAREERVRGRFWSTFRKAAGQIPFAEDVVAAYYCALDAKTPQRAKATLLAALAYFIVPVDFIPDFIIGVGFGDDMAVLTAAIATIRAHMKPEHYDAARKALDNES